MVPNGATYHVWFTLPHITSIKGLFMGTTLGWHRAMKIGYTSKMKQKERTRILFYNISLAWEIQVRLLRGWQYVQGEIVFLEHFECSYFLTLSYLTLNITKTF